MKLTENQISRIKDTVTHEMGHFLFYEKIMRGCMSRKAIANAKKRHPAQIRIIISRNSKGQIKVGGYCCHSSIKNIDDELLITLGGPAIDYRVGRFNNFDESINACFWVALNNDNADLTKLLNNYANRREVLELIKKYSKSFKHKDFVRIDRLFDLVLRDIKKNYPTNQEYILWNIRTFN